MIGGSSSLQNELYALLKELEDKNDEKTTSRETNSITTDTMMNENEEEKSNMPTIDADEAINNILRSKPIANDEDHMDEITQDLHGGANIVEMVENIFAGGGKRKSKGSSKSSSKGLSRGSGKSSSKGSGKSSSKHNNLSLDVTNDDAPNKDYSGQEIIDQIFNGKASTDINDSNKNNYTSFMSMHATRGGNNSTTITAGEDIGVNADMFNVSYNDKDNDSDESYTRSDSSESSDSEHIKRIRREMNSMNISYNNNVNEYINTEQLNQGFNPSDDSSSNSDQIDEGEDTKSEGEFYPNYKDNDSEDDKRSKDNAINDSENTNKRNSDGDDISNGDSDSNNGISNGGISNGDSDSNNGISNGAISNGDSDSNNGISNGDSDNGESDSDSDSDSDSNSKHNDVFSSVSLPSDNFTPIDEYNIGLDPNIIDKSNPLDIEEFDNEYNNNIGLDPDTPDSFVVNAHKHANAIKIIHEMRANDNNITLNGGNVKTAKRIKMMNMYPWILKSSSRY